MNKYRVIIRIDYYLDEIIEAEDDLDLQEKVRELESDAAEHASEDINTDFYCLDCEEDEDSEPGGDNSESWYDYKNAQEEERASKQ